MFSHINLGNFTKALIAFCLAVFVFALLANSNNASGEILRYIILVGVVLLLLLYNYTLEQYGSENSLSSLSSVTGEHKFEQSYKIQFPPTKGLYDELQMLVRSTVKAMNQSFETAIYMIDPELQVFKLQQSELKGFANTIPVQNKIIS